MFCTAVGTDANGGQETLILILHLYICSYWKKITTLSFKYQPRSESMTLITLLGLSAAILTTGAYIPQAYKTIKTKSTSGLSLSTFLMLFLGTILWFLYGLYINDLPIILANGITATLSGIIFYLKVTIKTEGEN
jgi:MtN3 and saliva related transmembrane protein